MRSGFITQACANRFMQPFGKAPFLCKRFFFPDLFSITKLRGELRIAAQDGSFQVIRFVRQMPEMKPNGSAVAFGLLIELLIVQIVSKIKDNLVNILEAVECVEEGGSRHIDTLSDLIRFILPHPSPLPKGERTPFPIRGKGRG